MGDNGDGMAGAPVDGAVADPYGLPSGEFVAARNELPARPALIRRPGWLRSRTWSWGLFVHREDDRPRADTGPRRRRASLEAVLVGAIRRDWPAVPRYFSSSARSALAAAKWEQGARMHSSRRRGRLWAPSSVGAHPWDRSANRQNGTRPSYRWGIRRR